MKNEPIRQFRGRNKITQKWAYGYYVESKEYNYGVIYVPEGLGIEVDPKTVGQATGLLDKNKNMIFENDIVKHTILVIREKYIIRKIVFENYGFIAIGRYKGLRDEEALNCIDKQKEELEIIGNIFENKDLI